MLRTIWIAVRLSGSKEVKPLSSSIAGIRTRSESRPSSPWDNCCTPWRTPRPSRRKRSTYRITARVGLWRSDNLAPDWVTGEQHDKALDALRATLAGFEEGRNVDGLRPITPAGRQLFENRWAGSDWIRVPRAAAVLDKEASRALPDKDAVQLAMCWEAVCRTVVNDPGVLREVTSQVLRWRNDVIAQCEASAPQAQMLRWACEGAAFREMDRFAFEAAFPHHARAAEMTGAAVIEAEKHEAVEAQRFLSNARENIAQRIECGDMARIAARAAASRNAT